MSDSNTPPSLPRQRSDARRAGRGDGADPADRFDALGRLARETPTQAPPDWLDHNIRAAARAHLPPRNAPAGSTREPAAGGRSHWRWLPLGGTLATALLAVLLVITRHDGVEPPTADSVPPAAPAPAVPATASAPAPAVPATASTATPAPARAPAQTAGAPAPATDGPVRAESVPAVPTPAATPPVGPVTTARRQRPSLPPAAEPSTTTPATDAAPSPANALMTDSSAAGRVAERIPDGPAGDMPTGVSAQAAPDFAARTPAPDTNRARVGDAAAAKRSAATSALSSPPPRATPRQSAAAPGAVSGAADGGQDDPADSAVLAAGAPDCASRIVRLWREQRFDAARRLYGRCAERFGEAGIADALAPDIREMISRAR